MIVRMSLDFAECDRARLARNASYAFAEVYGRRPTQIRRRRSPGASTESDAKMMAE
jgi:hypothetical protein